jgi:hypothetical protein
LVSLGFSDFANTLWEGLPLHLHMAEAA